MLHSGIATGERRESPRSGLRLGLGFRRLDAHPPTARRGVTLDVSRTGIRFRSDEFVPVGAFLALDVALPREGTHASRARTVWVRRPPVGEHWEVGARFLRSEGDGDAALAETLVLGA